MINNRVYSFENINQITNKKKFSSIASIFHLFDQTFTELSKDYANNTDTIFLKHSFPCCYFYPSSQIDQIFIFNKFINSLMRDGKKTTCYKLIKEVHEKLKYYYNLDFISLLSEALFLLMPTVRLKNYRQGKKIIQKPYIIKQFSSRLCFAIKWLHMACEERTETSFVDRLIGELLDIVYFNKGKALKYKENVYKIAHENRMYLSNN
jgi:small subunit ribosomal protein S7